VHTVTEKALSACAYYTPTSISGPYVPLILRKAIFVILQIGAQIRSSQLAHVEH